MKPRVFQHNGRWYCRCAWWLGFGDTPKQSYTSWILAGLSPVSKA